MRIYSYTARFLYLVSLTVLLACNKTVTNVNSNLPPLNPANEDLNAGTWKLMYDSAGENASSFSSGRRETRRARYPRGT